MGVAAVMLLVADARVGRRHGGYENTAVNEQDQPCQRQRGHKNSTTRRFREQQHLHAKAPARRALVH
jgi:hypothetical protein